MIQPQLDVYRIDMKYIRNLHKIDDRVLSVSPQIGKDERPFLGVIIMCNGHKYCVPLSKPKNKHVKMRDKIDFKKIMCEGSLIGVLNFNLMIPVENAQIQRIDTKIRKHDNADTKKKKQLLIMELEWCNNHKRDLINTANVLYQKYVSGESFSAREQCLDFRRMEQECCRYNERLNKQNNVLPMEKT
jgi:protein AbiQ